MAQTTIELRHVVGMKNFKLFDFEYPIVDTTWKNELEKLFLDYYYFYEIGVETIDRFKHELKTRMNLIMPYYNELYLTTLFEIDPLVTTRIKEEYTDTGNSNIKSNTTDKTKTTNSNTVTGTAEDNTVETDYPQTTNIENDIPTRRGKNTNNNSSTSQGAGGIDVTSINDITQSNMKDYQKIIEGVSGDQSELLRSYRKNIVNINRLIINELKTLFILVY